MFEATGRPEEERPFAGVRRGRGAQDACGRPGAHRGRHDAGQVQLAVAVREPSGAVYVEDHDLASGKNVDGWLHWPLVRGCRALVESLLLGFKALEIAALHAFAEEDDEGHDVAAAPSPSSGAAADKPAFSWKDDFGRPDTVMDALGAQTSLQVVSEPADPASDAGAPPARVP